METNQANSRQIVLFRKIMQIESVSFNKAIEIADNLAKNDLLDYYINEMHKEEFADILGGNNGILWNA